MTRARRFTVALWLPLLPCVLGFKGCYFGNDEVPLGSNARFSSGGAADEDASGASGDEGGATGAAGQPGHRREDEPVFVLESKLQFVPPSGAAPRAAR